MPGKELEDEAAALQYATKASVPAYSDLMAAARLLRLLRPSYTSRPRRRRGAPRWRASRGRPSAGREAEGGATRSVEVGVSILPLDSLVVAVAVLLVTPARGGIFIVGGALHAALYMSSKISKDLDGEQAALH